ncbi:Cysteine desulfurase [Roseivivax jejudonensis]|uniref:Cysteine desulfurase n=1 Tax=Roseivivax jejudonensis TaxID=1529041 RepID=A0A1X6Z6A8_9RHOB|nr:aminotransferase class V-fold PLP-dependent enzyme [Roseivivax jejudonensis]SLN41849.1 Cysteine desulfurase [Roseivivax jejudonensis]
MDLDIDWVRAQFPAFATDALKDQAFFENAGGSYTCRPVIERLLRFYTERKMQPYGPSEPSRLGGAEMDEARRRLAALLGVETEQVSFGPSTTQNAYVLAQAFRDMMAPGEAIVVTDQDHEANSGPWRRLADAGIEIREWRMDPATGHLDPAALERLLDDKVRLVCFPHCSNVVGEINPVAEITALAHSAGAFACVDGVSYAPHGLPDVSATGADIYLFSAYKTYGPHQGIMVMRPGLGALLPNQAHHFNDRPLYKRFTPAGPDHAQVAASAGMADYFEDMAAHHGVAPAAAHDLMRAHEIRLLQPLLDAVGGRNDVRLLGPADAASRAPTVALSVPRPAEAAAALAARGVIAGASDFYAGRALGALGIDPGRGVLRLSFVHYTSEAEVARAIEALDAVL